MGGRKLKIGARGSPLSLAQTGLVARALAGLGLETETVVIKTTGDRILDAPLAAIGGKGLFVKEIEEALLDGAIDLAVHSAKDLPAELPEGLTLGPTMKRADCRDVLISREPGGLAALKPGALVGTSGLRRQAQLLAARPDLRVTPLRGNVGTRLAKVRAEVEATILAAAGLARLELAPPNAVFLEPEVMLPAVAQGQLALELRAGDGDLAGRLAPLEHSASALALAAERGFLKELGSGCQLPVAALALAEEGRLVMTGLIAALDGQALVRGRREAPAAGAAAARIFGAALARELLDSGGREIMERLGRGQ